MWSYLETVDNNEYWQANKEGCYIKTVYRSRKLDAACPKNDSSNPKIIFIFKCV